MKALKGTVRLLPRPVFVSALALELPSCARMPANRRGGFNLMRLVGAALTLSGLSFYTRHLLNHGGAPHFFWMITGAVIALLGVWFLFWPSARDQQYCRGDRN